MPDAEVRRRLHLLDEVRGFAVVCMVFFHAFFAMAEVFDMPPGQILLDFFTPAEAWFAGLFIVISGFCCRLSRSNAKRGALLLAVAAALTGVTLLADRLIVPGLVIWFGILHLLSVSMLLFALLRRALDKIPPVIGAAVCAGLFLLCYCLPEGALGVAARPLWPLPQGWYGTDWLAPLGFHTVAFASADYFPLLPWTWLFLCGSFLGVAAERGRVPAWCYPKRVPPLAFVGRHALPVYLAHQPVIFAVLWAVNALLRR